MRILTITQIVKYLDDYYTFQICLQDSTEVYRFTRSMYSSGYIENVNNDFYPKEDVVALIEQVSNETSLKFFFSLKQGMPFQFTIQQ